MYFCSGISKFNDVLINVLIRKQPRFRCLLLFVICLAGVQYCMVWSPLFAAYNLAGKKWQDRDNKDSQYGHTTTGGILQYHKKAFSSKFMPVGRHRKNAHLGYSQATCLKHISPYLQRFLPELRSRNC
jgi:hypothetical protein